VRTAVNNREPLFHDQWRVAALLLRVLRKVKKLFPFEMRGFALEGGDAVVLYQARRRVSVAAIMQWLKQTFAARFNRRDGRTGHLWGDRYWSRALEGEPPERAAAVDWKAGEEEADSGGQEAEDGWGQTPSGGGGGGNPVFTRNPPSLRVSLRVKRGEAPR
jgi:REP element-mobilizing transposase RayT